MANMSPPTTASHSIYQRKITVLRTESCWLSSWGCAISGHTFMGGNSSYTPYHASLTWLMNFKEPEGQLTCWLKTLQDYDYRTIGPMKRLMKQDRVQSGKLWRLWIPRPRPSTPSGTGLSIETGSSIPSVRQQGLLTTFVPLYPADCAPSSVIMDRWMQAILCCPRH